MASCASWCRGGDYDGEEAMCGGAILANLKKPEAVGRRLTEAALWPEKKKPRRGGGGGRSFAGIPVVELDEEDEDFEADFEEFEVDSGDSDLELGAKEEVSDDEVVEIKPLAVKRSFSGGIRPFRLWEWFNLYSFYFRD